MNPTDQILAEMASSNRPMKNSDLVEATGRAKSTIQGNLEVLHRSRPVYKYDGDKVKGIRWGLRERGVQAARSRKLTRRQKMAYWD